MPHPTTTIERASVTRLQASLPALVDLLQDAVAHGASIGFLHPLSASTAQAYWQEVISQVDTGSKIIWLAMRDARLCGAVQLAPCSRENGRQRAEVQKLFVMHQDRQRGIAAQLMKALERYAQAHAIRTLHLDTEEHSGAEAFYQHLAYVRVGVIPDYAQTHLGQACGTAIYYKQLTSPDVREVGPC